ncbi:hypothetical protein SAMN06265795_10542 [Noviherbaspirillum humi]|uniref:DUF1330 domain-containing protein n=1 Tax=Noviherbaspirillum humi TaxID=1688639 RepID=A0A239GJ72_9BURK|nr:hypothetical protein [Noviherbaspirillum humi]SNS68828.1 hypothetical protein SAMN06265795_10542 [Noviherbaspirillum humi]
MNQVIQIYLPLYGNAGERLPRALYDAVRDELVGRFGGITAYTRVPAHGIWQEPGDQQAAHDDIVIYEVIADRLDVPWWQSYRADLEARFRQEQILIRAQPVQIL